MKKLLALILAAICCLGMFAACSEEDHTKELESAVAYLNNLYKDKTASSADFEVVGVVKVGEKTYDVTWTVSNSAVKVVKNGNMYTIDVPDTNDAEVTYTLTATVKAGKQSKTKEFTVKLPVIIFDPFEDEPVEGQAYKLMLIQANLGKNCFATHDISGSKYYATTEDAAEAPDFFAEKDGEGYKFYTMIEGTKSYVVAYLEGTSKRLKYDAAEGTVWTYEADCKAWFTTIDGGEYVLGTYNTFDTFCISEASYINAENTGVTQFPGNLITLDNVSKLEPADEIVVYDTVEKIYEEASKLADNQPLSGGHVYSFTGVITSIDTEYSADYGNVTVTIEVEGKSFQCFRLSGEGADTIKVGDTIKVDGPVTAYKGKVQVNKGTLQSVTAA